MNTESKSALSSDRAQELRAKAEPLRLTPEILGRIVFYAWQAFVSSPERQQPDEDMLEMLRRRVASAPTSIKDILHIEDRSDGQYLEESTRMLVGVQATGAIGRLNPRHTQPVYKIDSVHARSLLRRYERIFPQETNWVKEVITNPKRPLVE